MSVRCSLGHDNPDGSLYCDECGDQLTLASASTPGEATPSRAQPHLVLEADGTSFPLQGKQDYLIGREDPVSKIFPDVDLTAHGGEDGGVSRMHATISIRDGQYVIEDMNSTNCTFLNRQKLASRTPTPLNDGDEIRAGRVVLTFHAT